LLLKLKTDMLAAQARKKYGMMLRWVVALCTVFPLLPVRAQSVNNQFWLETMINYPFASSFNLENTVVFSTVAESPRWRSVDYTPTLEYSLTQNFDLMAAVTTAFTEQMEDYNSVEIRPMLGTRIHITPNQRVLLRTFIRIEQRNFLNLETKDWTAVWRPRMRVESLIPINKRSYFENKLWYGVLDAELLFAVDDDVEERFANRFRLRTGIGYRLSYTSRFEFLFMLQESKNGINEDFESSDTIFRFRYKLYLNKSKPSTLSGSGN